jgi:putative ABC transport system ATP-binding protein
MIEMVNASKTYHQGAREVRALQDVSFRIEKGEFLSIMGPSGSGKSTLLNLIGGLDQPTSGEIFIDGRPSTASPTTNSPSYGADEWLHLPVFQSSAHPDRC